MGEVGEEGERDGEVEVTEGRRGMNKGRMGKVRWPILAFGVGALIKRC